MWELALELVAEAEIVLLAGMVAEIEVAAGVRAAAAVVDAAEDVADAAAVVAAAVDMAAVATAVAAEADTRRRRGPPGTWQALESKIDQPQRTRRNTK